jgi:biopolymer transport protein ExbD/biopolymer transport protein TolR
MRRFSQRNALVTLSDINITPLLDLAFVLLIIFVITTPFIEQSLELKLPPGGAKDRALRREDFRTVEVSPQGVYLMQGRPLPLAQAVQELLRAHQSNPNLVVYVRADKLTPWENVFALTDLLSARGLTRFSFRAAPPETAR